MTMNAFLVSCFMSIIHLMDADQLALTGSPVQLLCPYKATPSKHILWNYFVAGRPVLLTDNNYINTITLSPEVYNRLSVSGNHSAGEYHLTIADVRKSDEGRYQCSVSTNGMTIMLTVIVGPTAINIENVTPDNKIPGIEGKDMTIKCTAVGGQPAPDVKIVILGSTYTGKQSAQRTFKPHSSFDGSIVTCQAGYEEISYFQFNTTAYIYLKLKPNIISFDPDTLDTKETKSFDVSCRSSGSRPAATMYWLLGQQNVTSNSTSLSYHDPSTDKYSVTSNLRYRVDRSYNKQKLICGAVNVAGSIETSFTVNVKYAPDIIVNSPIYTQNDADRTVTCNPSGNPDSYTYYKWQQKSKYGEIIREFGGNKTLKLPDVHVVFRYQDTGEYVCTASNGIKDKYNKFEQTGSGLVTLKAQPVFTSDTIDKVKQFGEINKAVDIYVDVYSVPQFYSYIWSRDGTPITTQNSAKYQSSSSSTIVKDEFHGKDVQLDGYNVTLTIHDLKAEDFVNYTVALNSGFQDVKFTIVLESASEPETPANFSRTGSAATSFTVQWVPNSGAGYKQTFYIQYRVQGSSEWTTVSAGEEDINEQRRRRTYEVKNLQEGKAYELRLYAENTVMKRSNFTDVLIVFTEGSVSTTSNAVIGAVVAVVVTLVIVCASFIVILLFKRSQVKDKNEKNDKYYENTGFQDIQRGVEYEEVENKFDVEHTQSSQTYETLDTKDKLSVYDDLENAKGVTSSKFSMGDYEALGVQDKPSIYAEMKNQKEQKQLRKQHAGKTKFKKSHNPSKNIEINTTQEPTEKVYENEVF